MPYIISLVCPPPPRGRMAKADTHNGHLRVESVPLGAIHPAPWNVRTQHAVDSIADSIRVVNCFWRWCNFAGWIAVKDARP